MKGYILAVALLVAGIAASGYPWLIAQEPAEASETARDSEGSIWITGEVVQSESFADLFGLS